MYASVRPLSPDAMNPNELKITHRLLPHWKRAGSCYFITFRVASGELTADERSIVLMQTRSGHDRFYTLVALVVMPDHIHVLLHALDGFDLSRILKGIKGVSARLINQNRGTSGQLWQEESFDRIIRDSMELDEKLNYIINNPVKAGLAADGWEYPWFFVTQSTDE